MDIKEIKKKINYLRRKQLNFINVSNTEWYSLFKDEIRNSIAIEGVFANRSDLLNVLERNKRTDKEKTASILGYFDSASSMYEYAHNQYKEQEFTLRLSDVKQIHTLLMRYEKDMGIYPRDLGDFRKGNVEVSHATFKPIDVYYIKDAKLDSVILAAISHVWFETIHPFRDGNGRVGRILLSYLLIGEGLVNIAIKGVAKNDRNKYYDALEKADDCFEILHRDLEKKKKISVKDVDNYLKDTDFNIFEGMLIKRLENSVSRLSVLSKDVLNKYADLSLRDMAEAYNYSQDYLRNLINRGELKAHKKGKLWYVKVGDMEKYIERVSENS